MIFLKNILFSEVDFVIDKGFKVVPIKVKYKELSKIRIERSLKSFIKKYDPKKAYIVGISGEKEEYKINGTKVFIIPFSDLIFLNI